MRVFPFLVCIYADGVDITDGCVVVVGCGGGVDVVDGDNICVDVGVYARVVDYVIFGVGIYCV